MAPLWPVEKNVWFACNFQYWDIGMLGTQIFIDLYCWLSVFILKREKYQFRKKSASDARIWINWGRLRSSFQLRNARGIWLQYIVKMQVRKYEHSYTVSDLVNKVLYILYYLILQIMGELKSNGVNIYHFPTDDQTVADTNNAMNVSIPLCIICPLRSPIKICMLLVCDIFPYWHVVKLFCFVVTDVKTVWCYFSTQHYCVVFLFARQESSEI